MLGGGPPTESVAAEAVCAGVTDCMHTLANEPSLGLYYVMEHIQRCTPNIIGDKQQIARSGQLLHGATLDAGFALDELKVATSSKGIFQRVTALVENAATRQAALQQAVVQQVTVQSPVTQGAAGGR